MGISCLRATAPGSQRQAIPLIIAQTGPFSKKKPQKCRKVSGRLTFSIYTHPWQQPAFSAVFFAEGGTSLAGFAVKNPFGLRRKPIYAVGITG